MLRARQQSNKTRSSHKPSKYLRSTYHSTIVRKFAQLDTTSIISTTFGSLQGHKPILIILFLCLQNIISQTETNTRSVTNISEYPTKLPNNFRILNEAESIVKMTRATKPQEEFNKYKVSPTRIRFSSANYSINRNAKSNQENESRGQTRYPGLVVNSAAVDFSNKRSKSNKQMAPAYELWPDTSDNANHVLRHGRKFQNNIGPIPYSRLADYHDNRGQILANATANLNLNSLRGLLPKPLPLVESSANNRVIRVRSTQTQIEDEPDSSRDEGELADENMEERSDMNVDRDNSEDKDSLSSQFNDGRTYTQSSNHKQINFKVFDSQQASNNLLRRRRLKESQIYPPGDPERLYADALLVYVKDFNQYIR